MPSLWFVVPVHGRAALTAICLRQLRRTCDALTAEGIEASAVIVGDDENLETASELGFGTVERDNRYVSRKFNDGIQLACDPTFNPRPVDYVVPCGSDDWVDWRLFTHLPARNIIVGFQRMAFVRDGREITTHFLNYPGGAGIRIYSREVMSRLSYRPADEDRRRACDTSILTNVRRHLRNDVVLEHRHLHDYQIVDWKTQGEQLNEYDAVAQHFRPQDAVDPFEVLCGIYPDEALEEMRAHYTPELVAA